VADLTHPLDFPDTHFDFVMCNAVIQHIDPESLTMTTIPELTRVLKPGEYYSGCSRTGAA
jgi:ubiquinone/menaquinone biosynthesis C-methylase UbiE